MTKYPPLGGGLIVSRIRIIVFLDDVVKHLDRVRLFDV